MHTKLIREKLFEQSEVYQAIKNGDTHTVKYSEYQHESWGICDANYLNRMRIAYYLLYFNIDDEDTIVYLYQEELKDRKSNSFQGIGNTLNVLTTLLKNYNHDNRYDSLLEEAKNANFDCACGFDKNYHIDNDISSLNLIECIFLTEDLDYKDVMEELVDKWKNSITEWTDGNRTSLIKFNTFLGKEQENEVTYIKLLENAIISDDTFHIVSAYRDLIRYYIDSNCLKIGGFVYVCG